MPHWKKYVIVVWCMYTLFTITADGHWGLFSLISKASYPSYTVVIVTPHLSSLIIWMTWILRSHPDMWVKHHPVPYTCSIIVGWIINNKSYREQKTVFLLSWLLSLCEWTLHHHDPWNPTEHAISHGIRWSTQHLHIALLSPWCHIFCRRDLTSRA